MLACNLVMLADILMIVDQMPAHNMVITAHNLVMLARKMVNMDYKLGMLHEVMLSQNWLMVMLDYNFLMFADLLVILTYNNLVMLANIYQEKVTDGQNRCHSCYSDYMEGTTVTTYRLLKKKSVSVRFNIGV